MQLNAGIALRSAIASIAVCNACIVFISDIDMNMRMESIQIKTCAKNFSRL